MQTRGGSDCSPTISAPFNAQFTEQTQVCRFGGPSHLQSPWRGCPGLVLKQPGTNGRLHPSSVRRRFPALQAVQSTKAEEKPVRHG